MEREPQNRRISNIQPQKEEWGAMGPIGPQDPIPSSPEILTDERLNYLAERYILLSIRHYTGVPFHKYLLYPDQFDRMAETLRKGKQITAELHYAGQCFVAHTMN